jgi:hypothetical protein
MLARPGLALTERLGGVEVDLPDGVRVRVDSSVKEKALRRVLSAVRGWDDSACRREPSSSSPASRSICDPGLTVWRPRCSRSSAPIRFSGHVFIFAASGAARDDPGEALAVGRGLPVLAHRDEWYVLSYLHLQFCGDTTLRDGLRFHDNEPVQSSIPKICARSSPRTLLPLPIS